MRKVMAGGFGAAMALAAGVAQAQLAPPVVEWKPEFYVGGGGLFGTGIGRFVQDRLTISNGELGGFAPFGYIGVRVPFRSVYLGLEGEYDVSRRSSESVVDEPGQPFITTIFSAGRPTLVNLGTVGASTTRFSASVSDRAAVFGTAFLPIGGVELFVKGGFSYWNLKESYSITYNGPAGFSFTSNGFQAINAVNVLTSTKQNVYAPVLGGGIQMPFGSFFLRAEGQVEFTSLKRSIMPYFTQFGTSFPPFLTAVTAQSLANSDAKFLLSIGYKW